MANVQAQMTNVKADLEYNAFDLSERHLFSAKSGQLLPVYNKQVVPGDYFEIDIASFLRTMPVETASFARMRQHVDFFFVPYKQLWSKFPQMKYQRRDPVHAISSLASLAVTSPWCTMSDFIQAVLQNQTVPGQDPFGFYNNANAARLADLLGYGNYEGCIDFSYTDSYGNTYPYVSLAPNAIPAPLANKHVNIWPWLAYQKIWSDYYRNPWFDSIVTPVSFNLDDIEGDTSARAQISLGRLQNSGIFTMRYRQWKKDYFTGVFPDRQFGDISQVVGSDQLGFKSVVNPPTATYNMVLRSSAGSPDIKSYVDSYNANNALSLYSGVTALDLRRAELLQIWKEKTLRAGFHTEKQQLAHFGVQSETMDNYHVEFLGGSSSVVNISEVINTTNLGAPLGELGGKGVSLNTSDKIRYKVKDDGLIMAIFSILPESEYNAYGIQREHMRLDPFDYFTPAFQNLGFESVQRWQLDGVQMPGFGDDIFGYVPPYMDMKLGVDRVHGEFMTAPLSDAGSDWPLGFVSQNPGSLSQFDTARVDTYFAQSLPFFYVNPRICDSIFVSAATDDPDTDQFIVNCYFSIKAVRPMSVLGLPNY